jgi:hypothetical protein
LDALARREVSEQIRERLSEGSLDPLGDRPSCRRDPHVNGASVLGAGFTLHQPSVLSPVDEPTDAGFLKAEVARKFKHARLAVAEDPQEPYLGERQLVTLGDVAQEILDDERHFDQRISGSIVRIGGPNTVTEVRHVVSVLDLVLVTN